MSKSFKKGGGGPGGQVGEKTDQDIRRLKNIVGKVEEASKINLDQMIQNFLSQPELPEIAFPTELSNLQRAYVHFQASRHGLKSFSTGTGSQRRLTLRRTMESTALETKILSLTEESSTGVSSLMAAFPPQEFYNLSDISSEQNVHNSDKSSTSRIGIMKPAVPDRRPKGLYDNYRSRLPIWSHKDTILDFIDKHRVIFIKGSTGCGKTTQVGQFILEDAALKNKKVRIICTVPRRIAAISVSERVSCERGEQLGQTVGYQIRLESCISPIKTLLIYCTSGILLRSLSSPGYRFLQSATHIIIDEVHERDRQTDFLLACLRDILPMFPNLRLILMGADLNNELFSNYFGESVECPIIQVEGTLHPVQAYFLEDTLDLLRYENHEMGSTRQEDERTNVYNNLIEKFQGTSRLSDEVSEKENKRPTADFQLVHEDVDQMIQKVWTEGDEEAEETFVHLVEYGEVPVDYQHSSAGVTMLMAAAARGMIDLIHVLLQLGADVNLKSKNKEYFLSAIEWSSDHRQHEALKVLMEHQYKTKLIPAMNKGSMNSAKYQRLTRYLKSVDEERVDLLLILHLVHRIHLQFDTKQAILVFLPGYDEIVTLKHLILSDHRLDFRHGTFRIFMLHSNIQTGDQRGVFENPGKGVRKIVLSTNIAETSLTIEDIVFVIDSGKAKEKSFDSMTGVTQLKSVWISKASVNQRRGRAGRCQPGICYHLFSSARYESMSQFPVPEIVRTSLQELCLHARSFMKPEVKIETFFSKIPEPPAPIAVKKSVELLKVMGALNENEILTKLGCHLLHFPLEPFLGKALIFAIVFKCLDPIVTLVSIISYRDPFQLPTDPRDKQKAQQCKARFAGESFSDHMAFLGAFQDWETARTFRGMTERRFCRENYLSSFTFEMVYAIRQQLVGQLRASGFIKTKGRSDLKELNSNSDNWPMVKGVLVATLYPNICGIDRAKKILYNGFCSKIAFHGSTTVAKKKNGIPEISTEWMIFDEMSHQGSSNVVKGCTCVSTAAIALFAGSYTPSLQNSSDANHESPLADLKINQWITFCSSKEIIETIKFLRQKINELIFKRLDSPSVAFSKLEEKTIQTIASLLVTEDKATGFKNREQIDQWPKFVAGNLMSVPVAGYDDKYETETEHLNRRFYIAELDQLAIFSEIVINKMWSVPEALKSKFWSDEESATPASEIVVFFWVREQDQFIGAIKIDGDSSGPAGAIHDVPIELLSQKLVEKKVIVREANFATSRQLPMNGLELERDLAKIFLKIFEAEIGDA